MRHFLTAFFILTSITLSYGQVGMITGRIADSSGSKLLPLATITVYKATDTTIVTYRLSTETGEFRVPGLPFNTKLRLLATFSGYLPYRLDFELSAEKPSFSAGLVKLKPTASTLDEIVVIAERPPVIFKNDTIEFNASAFKTLPTALVEDLLKKMPGIEIDEAGNITMNGRRVNRILIDGKRFFGDDPKMASRNLPANIIEKVQVLDDKEELALNNDGNLSNIGKIINLTLKKEYKKSLFGKLAAGAGSDNRHELSGIINTLRDTLQLSLIAFSNNINRSAFTLRDFTSLGGFDRSGMSSMTIYSGNGREGISVNGVSFGGTGTGITSVKGAGLNLNHAPSKRFSFYAQYIYGNSSSVLEQEQNIERFAADTIYNIHSINNSTTQGFSHTLGTGMNWKPDTLTNMTLSASYNYINNNSGSPISISSQNNKLGPLSSTSGVLTNLGDNQSYSHNLSISHRFSSKKGRIISISHSASRSTNPLDAITENINTFYVPAINTSIFKQLRRTGAPTTSLSLFANYSDPISGRLILRINQRVNYDKFDRDIVTFGIPYGSKGYDSIIVGLSNGISREQTRWSNGISLGYKIKKININFTPSFLSQWIQNNFIYNSALASRQHYGNFLLNASINTSQLNFGFTQDVSAPSIFYMNPVIDNSNPLLISQGNPDLLPTKRNSFDFFANIAKPGKSLSYFFSATSGFLDNYIVISAAMTRNGVEITKPVNVNGVINNFLSFRVSKQYKSRRKLTANIELGAVASLNKVPIVYNSIQSGTTALSGGLNTRVVLNWHDVVELNARYNPSLTRTTYESLQFKTNNIVTQNLTGEIIVRQPRKVVWESNIAYKALSNVSSNFPSTNTSWNAAVTFLMLSQNRVQLKLAVYDILNRNNSVSNIINGNSIIDTRTNVLKRYTMLTLSYNIRPQAKDKAKIGGRQSIFLF